MPCDGWSFADRRPNTSADVPLIDCDQEVSRVVTPLLAIPTLGTNKKPNVRDLVASTAADCGGSGTTNECWHQPHP